MWASLALLLFLSALHATAWAESPNDPARVLGLPWGAPVEAARQQFPDGQRGQETLLIATYTAAANMEGVLLSASFQFVGEEGLQGVILRFPVHRTREMVAAFERQYGLAPIRGNLEWRWQKSGVRISLGEYPNLRTGGRRGIAWLRTGVLEAAIARGDEASPPHNATRAETPQSQARYEERLVRKIYWALRYPATAHGVYRVTLAFRLSAGRPTALEVTVDPPNPEVAESVRAAVGRAQPFPSPPGTEDRRVTLDLTVTIMP